MRLDLHGTWRWNQIKPSVLAIGPNGSPEVPKSWISCTSMHPRCNAHAPSQENVPWVLVSPLQGYLPKSTYKYRRQHLEHISPRKLIMPMHPSLEFASDMDLSISMKLVGIENSMVSYVV